MFPFGNLIQMSKNNENPASRLSFWLGAKLRCASRHYRFAEARSQDKRFGEIHGFRNAVMLGFLLGRLIQIIKPEGVLFGLDLA